MSNVKTNRVQLVMFHLWVGVTLLTASCGGGNQQQEEDFESPLAEISCKLPPPSASSIPVYSGPVKPLPPANLTTPSDQAKWNKILAIAAAHALSQSQVFYRWGDRNWEDQRINWNPVFTISLTQNTANGMGAMAAGVGLYVAEFPHEYAFSTADIYQITVPGGMPTIDFSDPIVAKELGDTTPGNPYGTEYVSEYDVYHLGDGGKIISGSVTTMGAIPPPVAVKFNWGWNSNLSMKGWYWALKNPVGVKFEKFVGRDMNSAEIENNLDLAANLAGFFGALNFKNQLKPTLSKRIYKPGSAEVIPTPLTLVHPVSDWSSYSEISHCAVPAAPTNGGTAFWRRDGSCGLYTASGTVLVKDNVADRLCESKYPTEVCKIPLQGISSGSIVCKKVLRANPNVVIDPLVSQNCSIAPTCK